MKGLQSVTPKHPQEPSGELEPSRETLRSSLGTGTIPCPPHLCIQGSLHRHLHGSCPHHPKAEQHPVPRPPQLLWGCLFHMDFPTTYILISSRDRPWGTAAPQLCLPPSPWPCGWAGARGGQRAAPRQSFPLTIFPTDPMAPLLTSASEIGRAHV